MTFMWRSKMAGMMNPGHRSEIPACQRLLLHLDDAATDATAGVAGGLRFEVVFLRVDDHRLADDVVLVTAERDVINRQVHLRVSLVIGLKVAEIPGVDGTGRRAAVNML